MDITVLGRLAVWSGDLTHGTVYTSCSSKDELQSPPLGSRRDVNVGMIQWREKGKVMLSGKEDRTNGGSSAPEEVHKTRRHLQEHKGKL